MIEPQSYIDSFRHAFPTPGRYHTNPNSSLAIPSQVVGGGFIGLEMAENLVARGIKVTIVEMLPQVRMPNT